MQDSNSTLGFMVPGEWVKHSATWLAWPNDDDYFKGRMDKIEEACIEIVKGLHDGETIKLLVSDSAMEARAKNMLTGSGVDVSKIIFYQTHYVDIWVRDYGPVFLKNGNERKFLKWQYDGYGGQFPELLSDNEIFNNLQESIGLESIKIDFVLEGGAVEANGAGTLLTTEECLLDSRNKGKSREENEKILCENYGAKKVVWLKRGLLNDHTDGHIDEIARFVSPTKILCAFTEDSADPNYENMLNNFNTLESATDQDGNRFEVIKLPLPSMNFEDGTKAPVSYANFYIGNSTVLTPAFDDSNDARAVEILQKCFPDKKIVQIDCRDLIYGGGGIHCITCQEPE